MNDTQPERQSRPVEALVGPDASFALCFEGESPEVTVQTTWRAMVDKIRDDTGWDDAAMTELEDDLSDAGRWTLDEGGNPFRYGPEEIGETCTMTIYCLRPNAEIDNILQRYGADAFSYAWQGSAAMIMFQIGGRRIRFIVPMPDKAERQFTHVKHARRHFEEQRTEIQAKEAWDQACRQRWRALALVIKAKLEAVDSKITTVEEEFLAHIVLPNGQNVSQWMLPQVAHAYASGNMPPMLAGPSS